MWSLGLMAGSVDTLKADTTKVDTITTDTVDNKKPVFTVVKELPITSVKNQDKSGTCWIYSTLSFFESEILKKSGKTYDLCEMYVANKDYYDRAVMTMRLHGDMSFTEGGSTYDALYIVQHSGICPEDAMPLPGTMYGDTLNNFNEFFKGLSAYVKSLASSDSKKLTPAWKTGLQGIIDAYLGKTPETFVYEGKTYTPQSFSASLELDYDDYVSITSFTHHPFWTEFALEIPDNWRGGLSWNVPMEYLEQIIDNAIMNGHTVLWGGDVSEDGFSSNGLAYLIDSQKAADLDGSDMAHWLKLSKKEKVQKFGVNTPELTPSQEMRQKGYDNWELTDDHGMLIYGIAKDQTGREYYMVKNSWGDFGDYHGIWYMTKNFIIAKAMDLMVNKNALPKEVLRKISK